MHCPDVCPTDLQEISAAVDALGPDAHRVEPVFITVDPDRDTSEELATYVRSFHPRLVGLTGMPDDIRRVATSYKVFYKKVDDPRSTRYVMDHSAFIYLLAADGRYLGFFPPGTKADRILDVVRPHLGKSNE
jgi:protein SCO1/2